MELQNNEYGECTGLNNEHGVTHCELSATFTAGFYLYLGNLQWYADIKSGTLRHCLGRGYSRNYPEGLNTLAWKSLRLVKTARSEKSDHCDFSVSYLTG
jgi:hypothetical protein